ncbi:Claudin-18 [Merluccius polli]|uniref:Claudin-18 n=1 Tax=Merluccius polli TaxID=89951 RepID=A0AA47MEN0_MERPO|nr:Claudin-18 [Merluccius polli]
MAATLCQVMGFVLSVIGVAGMIAATAMDPWATQDLLDTPVTSVYIFSGLWNACVRQSSGFTECRPYFTILGLPGTLTPFLLLLLPIFFYLFSHIASRFKPRTFCLGLIGFMLSALGLFLISAATAMDMWSLQDRSGTVVTNVYTYSGLWASCVGTSYGTTQCRPYYTILGLPALLQAVRALMIVGIVLGAIGCLTAIFALKCLKMGNMEDNIKATMTLASGIMNLLAGVCGIAGVSAFANLIVQSFRFNAYADNYNLGGGGGLGGMSGGLRPQYTFGPALFVGWIGSAILVVGGVLMCLACRGMVPDDQQGYNGMGYKAPSQRTGYRSEVRPQTNYNASYKANSVEGRPNQRFDYV